jgi:hypothetical protein
MHFEILSFDIVAAPRAQEGDAECSIVAGSFDGDFGQLCRLKLTVGGALLSDPATLHIIG